FRFALCPQSHQKVISDFRTCSSKQSMKPGLHREITSACLPRHLAVAYLCLVRWLTSRALLSSPICQLKVSMFCDVHITAALRAFGARNGSEARTQPSAAWK